MAARVPSLLFLLNPPSLVCSFAPSLPKRQTALLALPRWCLPFLLTTCSTKLLPHSALVPLPTTLGTTLGTTHCPPPTPGHPPALAFVHNAASALHRRSEKGRRGCLDSWYVPFTGHSSWIRSRQATSQGDYSEPPLTRHRSLQCQDR